MTKNNLTLARVSPVENTSNPIPQFPSSRRLALHDKDEIENFVRKYPPYSDYNFTSLYYKRLEKGTYEMPEINSTSASIELDAQQLLLILEGISLLSVKKRRRYAHHFVDKNPINTIHPGV